MRRTVNDAGLTEKEYLEQYNPGNYERPSVTVDNVLFAIDDHIDHLQILLIKRKNHPDIDCWALPGGFVGINESAHTAALRELEEETGLKNVYLEQLYTYSRPERDPRMRVIDIAYMSLMKKEEVNAGDDAGDAAWFTIELTDSALVLRNIERNVEITYNLRTKVFKNGKICYSNYVPEHYGEEKLAFDHEMIIMDSILRLRNKIEYSDLAFNLVEDEFTLPDLQRIYEIILNKPLYKKNFRDKIASKVTPLNKTIKTVNTYRPSQAYMYNSVF